MEHTELIGASQILCGLNIKKLAAAAARRTFKPKEYLLQIGEQPSHVIIIEKGDVLLKRAGMVFKKLVPSRASQRLVLGISGVAGETANAADAQAWSAGPVDTLLIEGSVAREEVLNSREATRAVLRRQSTIIGELDASLDDVRLKRSPVVRLIRLLCRTESANRSERLVMRQHEIAAEVGSNHSDVSRAEKALREAELIVRDGDALEVRRGDLIRFMSFLQSLASPSHPIHAGRRLEVAVSHLCIDGWFSTREEALHTALPFLKTTAEREENRTILSIKTAPVVERLREILDLLPEKPAKDKQSVADLSALLDEAKIMATLNTLNLRKER